MRSAPSRPTRTMPGPGTDLPWRKPIGPLLTKDTELDPDLPEAWNAPGSLQAEAGDSANAGKNFRKALQIGESAGGEQRFAARDVSFRARRPVCAGERAPRFNYGVAFAKQSQFREAQTQVEASIQLTPEFAEAHDPRGATLLPRHCSAGDQTVPAGCAGQRSGIRQQATQALAEIGR